MKLTEADMTLPVLRLLAQAPNGAMPMAQIKDELLIQKFGVLVRTAPCVTRCCTPVIEAKRLEFRHAAFVVQAFNTPDASFQDYALFCRALNIPASRGNMATTSVDGISLSVGWADCPVATDKEVAATV